MTDQPTPVVDPDPVTQPVPEPVVKAAAGWGSLAALILTALAVLVAVGVLSSAQADAITTAVNLVTTNIVPIGTALVGISTLIGTLAGAHVTAFVARRKVRPVPPKAARR